MEIQSNGCGNAHILFNEFQSSLSVVGAVSDLVVLLVVFPVLLVGAVSAGPHNTFLVSNVR